MKENLPSEDEKKEIENEYKKHIGKKVKANKKEEVQNKDDSYDDEREEENMKAPSKK